MAILRLVVVIMDHYKAVSAFLAAHAFQIIGIRFVRFAVVHVVPDSQNNSVGGNSNGHTFVHGLVILNSDVRPFMTVVGQKSAIIVVPFFPCINIDIILNNTVFSQDTIHRESESKV